MSGEGHLLSGRYRFQTRIGAGAMGVVWQAHDELLHRVVAIKQVLLPPKLEPGEAEEARERAMREGRIAARLQHPNAIAVYDVTEDNGEPCLVMEYLPSRSLAAVIHENGPLPPREVARIGAQVASALAAAHDAGIVHRDIKPGNILLGDNGTVKITDFGISRAQGDVTVTKTGMLAGTPAYLSPDVAIGRDPSPASDVFSLGSTLYAAVEGVPPFGLDENTLALLHAVAAGNVMPPRQAGPLTGTLMDLLRARPEERPTMGQTVDLLNAVAAGQGTAGQSYAPAYAPTVAQQHPGDGTTRALNSTPSLRTPAQTRFDAHPPTPGGGTYVGGPSDPYHGQYPGPHSNGYPPPGRPPKRSRKALFGVLAVIVAAALGIGAAVYLNQTAKPVAAQTTPPQPTAAPDTPTPSDELVGNWSDAGKFVIDYYGDLVPHELDQAWAELTPHGQKAAGGRAKFNEYWAKVKSVSPRTALVPSKSNNPDGSVDVSCALTYQLKDGTRKSETVIVRVIRHNGQYMIDSKGE